MTAAAETISHSRVERLQELTDVANREQVLAAALDTLADAIYDIPVPVKHYEPVWEAVARRLRSDARESRCRAKTAAAHVEDVQAAIDARSRYAS